MWNHKGLYRQKPVPTSQLSTELSKLQLLCIIEGKKGLWVGIMNIWQGSCSNIRIKHLLYQYTRLQNWMCDFFNTTSFFSVVYWAASQMLHWQVSPVYGKSMWNDQNNIKCEGHNVCVCSLHWTQETKHPYLKTVAKCRSREGRKAAWVQS